MSRLLSLAVFFLCLDVRAQTNGPYSVIALLQKADLPASAASTPTNAISSALLRMGGIPPKDSVATANVTITAGRTTESGTMKISTRGTTQTLEEISLPSGVQRSVFSEGMGLKGFRDKTVGMTFEQSLSAQSLLFVLPWLSAQMSNPDGIVEDLGIDNQNAKALKHLRISKAFASNKQLQHYSRLTARDIWIDPDTGLPTKIAYERRYASGAVPSIRISLEYSDYRRIGGFLYPFSIRKFVNGTLWADISVQTVAFDTNIPDSNFSKN